MTPKHPILGTSSDAFALSLSLKFPKSMVQFFKFLQNDFSKFTLLLIVKFSIIKRLDSKYFNFFIKASFFTLRKILTHISSRLTFTGFSPLAKAVSTALLR